MKARARLVLALFTANVVQSTAAHHGGFARGTALPYLNVTSASISGISSGADLAGLYALAYAEDLVGGGVGIFAGQAFHCAVTRFQADELVNHTDPSVPVCDGCPPNTTLVYDHCKVHPEWVNVSMLENYARQMAHDGLVASLASIEKIRTFLYRGTQDTVYKNGSVDETTEVFKRLTPVSSVKFVNTVQSPHLVPGIDPYLCWFEGWSGPDNCSYDGAWEALKWIHGDEALQHGRDNRTTDLYTNFLYDFDQTPFFPPARDPLLADTGRVLVPEACAARNSHCSVHVFLHGCGVTETYDVFTKFAGFNEWASKNNFVVVYPRMSTRGTTKQQLMGCFDGYGQTGADYALKSAPQLQTIHNMLLAMGVGK